MTDYTDEPPMRTEDLKYPETLRLTLSDTESMFEDALATADTFEKGEEVHPEAIRAFQNIAELRELLTDRRLEILRSVFDDPPESITALADRLDRSYSLVHEDVKILAKHNIINFRDGSHGAKVPYCPYDSVRVDIPLVGFSETARTLRVDHEQQETDERGSIHVEDKELWLDDSVDPRDESSL